MRRDRLGFACTWDDPPEPTWSYTPWNLRAALRERVDVVDVGVVLGSATRTGLRLLGAHRAQGRWATNWPTHPATVALSERAVVRAARRLGPDVVLEIGDVARTRQPYVVYQDLSWDIVLERLDGDTHRTIQFPGVGPARMRRLRERQLEVYDGAAAVLTMSGWLARHLTTVTGVASSKIHVVPPGANGLPAAPPQANRPAPRRRLLFVGRDFTRKGGDQVLAALALLRRDVDPAITLTVAGPAAWPGGGPPPAGVEFLGRQTVSQIAALFARHDLFVMPSRFEGYGIVFVEALAHGVPCLARDDCAMPEIVRPGVNGSLVGTGDAAELAQRVVEVLADDALYAATLAAAPEVTRRYSWGRVADDVLRAVDRLR